MATNINPQPSLNEIRELLSPYLDGEVTEEERLWVEQAVVTSAELRQELEALRQTVNLLAALPPVAAPRPFTLSEADVQPVSPPKRSFWWSTLLGSLAMTAAALICVIIASWVLFANRFSSIPSQEIASSQEEAAAPQAPSTVALPEAREEAAGEVQVETGITVEVEKETDAEAVEQEAAPAAAEELKIEAAEAAKTNEPEITLAQPAEEAASAGAAESAEAGQEEAAPAAAPEEPLADQTEADQAEISPPAGQGETPDDQDTANRVATTATATSSPTASALPTATPPPAATASPTAPVQPEVAAAEAAQEAAPALKSAQAETEEAPAEAPAPLTSQADEGVEQVTPLAQATVIPTGTPEALPPTPTVTAPAPPPVAPSPAANIQPTGPSRSSGLASWLIAGAVLLALLILGVMIWSKINRKS